MLKDFQRETQCTVIVVSSFNRENYYKPVDFTSFKESGGLEYTADVIWGLEFYFQSDAEIKPLAVEEKRTKSPRQIRLKCLKNRNGQTYDRFFKYFSEFDYFEPCEESDFKKGYTSSGKKIPADFGNF